MTLTGLAVLAGAAATSAARAAPVSTPHVTAELVAERTAVQPGGTVAIGLRLQHIPHWHTYWRNPGDSGLPTKLQWTLPDGAAVGPIDWPAPQRYPLGPLVNFGYEGEVLLPMAFTAPAAARPGEALALRAKVDWLVCREVCIPETVQLGIDLPVVDAQTTPGASWFAPQFARTRLEQPVPLTGWRAELQSTGADLLLTLQREGAGGGALPAVEFFPYAEQTFVPSRHELQRGAQAYAIRLALQDGATLPPRLRGIVVAPPAPAGESTVWGSERRSAEIEFATRTVSALEWPPGIAPRATAGGSAGKRAFAGSATGPAAGADLGLLAALAFAFAGGMLLNLMPCVFPVLSIKLLGLVQHHVDTPAALRTHALAYAAGVVASFVALAGALLALRAAGEAVGWGFQLQEPAVVFVLALLFFAIGLNLAGVFEFGQMVPATLANWRAKRPAADAFGAGVLAVVVASPCTAPFMGAALGFAITQSPAVALSTFAALGAGMALPYVVLVLQPRWRARLPRPGVWMLRLRQAMAFPMFAAVVWLVWVFGQQVDIDGVARTLLALVGVALLLWLVALPALRGMPERLSLAMLLAGLLYWSWPGATGIAPTGATASTPAAGFAARWRPYDEAEIDQHLSQGRAVFVDFTAAWCITCQVNKRLVLDTEAMHASFDRLGVLLMRADWTRRDPVITDALTRLGRSGVPVYVLLAPGRAPLLLPELLTEGIVRDALAALQPAAPAPGRAQFDAFPAGGGAGMPAPGGTVGSRPGRPQADSSPIGATITPSPRS